MIHAIAILSQLVASEAERSQDPSPATQGLPAIPERSKEKQSSFGPPGVQFDWVRFDTSSHSISSSNQISILTAIPPNHIEPNAKHAEEASMIQIQRAEVAR